MVIGTYISIIPLNVNGLNAPTKRHRLAEWIQKQDLYICCLQETHFRPSDTYRLKVRGREKIFHANGNEKNLGQQFSYQIKQTLKKDYYKRQRRTLHNDQGINPRRRYINCTYLCTQHRSTSIDKANANTIKGETDSNTIIVADFNTPFSPKDRSSKMKINKETQALNDILNKRDLIDIYRTFHPKKTE